MPQRPQTLGKVGELALYGLLTVAMPTEARLVGRRREFRFAVLFGAPKVGLCGCSGALRYRSHPIRAQGVLT